MKIKIGDDYLEYEGDIEIEKKIKLFEEIEATEGDFSYQFEVFLTAKNIRVLGIPFADNSRKLVYNKIDCQVINDDGLELYKGYLRVEGVKNDFARLSFWSGNNTWFSMITGNLSDLDYSKYDVELTKTNITDSWGDTSGIVMPLLDTGALSERSFNDTVVEDFVGFLFVKEVIRDIFQGQGIKIKGELLRDYRYNNLLVSSNQNAQGAIDDRSCFIQKTTDQTVTTSSDLITFDNDSTPPFFDGSNDNFDLTTEQYTADVKMFVLVEVDLVRTAGTVGGSYRLLVTIRDSGGVITKSYFNDSEGSATDLVFSRAFFVEAGHTIEVRAGKNDAGYSDITVTSGTLKITPITLYKIFGNSILPKWTKQQFVSNVLRIFNCITEYNQNTGELTIDFFENIKSKTPLDISSYVSEIDVDYEDFISDFGRQSILKYQNQDIEIKDVEENLISSESEYNKSNNAPYGSGVIQVDNDFIKDKADIVESDFTAPYSYYNGVFTMPFDRLDFLENKENSGGGVEFTLNVSSVTDSSGFAQFNTSGTINLLVGHLVKIEDSTVEAYNGMWTVAFVDNTIPNFVLLGGIPYLPFAGNATMKMTKVDVVRTSSDSTYIILATPNRDITDYFASKSFWLSDNSSRSQQSNVSIGYFELLNNGLEASEKFKLGLSFGRPDVPLQFQIPLIESYWDLVGRILNDPVKLFCTANIPEKVFRNISFLNPVTLRTKETSNMYYLNRITGYKGSHLPCTLELIKLP